MENSATKTADDYHEENSLEESSWTYYMQDFILNGIGSSYDNDDDDQEMISSFSNYSSDLVSDAASNSARRKLVTNNEINCSEIRSKLHYCNNLSFKRPRKLKGGDDHDLEDTASSPVNSPKVN